MEVPTAQELATNYGLSQEELSQQVPHDLLVVLTMKMNSSREIAAYLYLDPTEREDIEEKGRSPQERRLMMLEKWKEKFGNDASFFKLVDSFLQAKRRDLADKVCDFFKKKVLPKQAEVYHTPKSTSLTDLTLQEATQGLLNNTTKMDTHEEDQANELQQLPSLQTNTEASNMEAETAQNRHESKVNVQLQNGCCILSCIAIFIVAIGIPVVFITVGTTIYKDYTPTFRSVYIPNERTLLMGEFDPFYVKSVTFFSSTDTHLYQTQCKHLSDWANQRTILFIVRITISQQNTYQVYRNYLVKGSELHFSYRNITITTGCQIHIYVFNDYALYVSFLKHGTRSGYIARKCLNSVANYYTFLAKQTQYYYFGLYISDTSESMVESVNVGIGGYELYFDVGENQPDCVTLAGIKRSCTLEFNRQHVQGKNICILGNTPNNEAATVLYYTEESAEVGKARTAFLWIGIILLLLALFCGLVSCCILLSVCCA